MGGEEKKSKADYVRRSAPPFRGILFRVHPRFTRSKVGFGYVNRANRPENNKPSSFTLDWYDDYNSFSKKDKDSAKDSISGGDFYAPFITEADLDLVRVKPKTPPKRAEKLVKKNYEAPASPGPYRRL